MALTGLFDRKAALSQIVLLGFVCFTTMGMFNALTSMGGTGISDSHVANIATALVYIFFCISAFFAGGIVNFYGVKPVLFVGAIFYCIYCISLAVWAEGHEWPWFVCLTGATLGGGAGLLHAAKGVVIMAYPDKDNKGAFISIFWGIFNLGGVIGAIITLATNYNETAANASTATFISFIIIMACGCGLVLLLTNPSDVIQPNGNKVHFPVQDDWKVEMRNLISVFKEPKMMLLAPLFAYSNFFYAVQFQGYNGRLFNTRTQGMNNIFYWSAQIFGAVLIGKINDNKNWSVRKRATIDLLMTFVLVNASWAGGLVMEHQRDPISDTYSGLDFIDDSAAWAAPFVIYILYGVIDAFVQCSSFWFMTKIAKDDGHKTARFSGFYKMWQSGMAAVSWIISSQEVEVDTQLFINWGMFLFAFVCACFAVNQLDEDTDSSQQNSLIDETQPGIDNAKKELVQ